MPHPRTGTGEETGLTVRDTPFGILTDVRPDAGGVTGPPTTAGEDTFVTRRPKGKP